VKVVIISVLSLMVLVAVGVLLTLGVGFAQAPKGGKSVLHVHVFNRDGKLVGPIECQKIVKTPAEWKKLLTPEQYSILRSSDTERPFCGALLDNKKEGVYCCAGCGLPLFASDSKFHSGTGWPSFFQPIAKGNVAEKSDRSHGMVRTEINCARCDGHLGHVFDDGPRPTGMRFCLNSASLAFTPSDETAKLADPLAENAKATPEADKKTSSTESPVSTATVVVAGGCFWCTEAAIEQLDGVIDVESGYSGGSAETANYESVCQGDTGHAEAIRITYDPSKINYDRLLEVFFDAHDPTTLNRQGHDVGTQYRSAIFYDSEEQKAAAAAKIDALNKKGTFGHPIVTTLEPLVRFYPAEAYHQDYARANPFQPYIRGVSYPKVCKIREKHADLIKKDTGSVSAER